MENSNNIQDYERLNRILNRVPNKGEFIDELESYVDDINNENELESVNSRLKHYVSYFFPILLIIIFLLLRFYPAYQETRPVSLNKLIKLHTQNKVTKKILVKHMYAEPFGEAIIPIMKIADSGSMHAQNITCWVYSEGINVTVNHTLSAEYCHKAAAQNHPGAQMNLGNHYAEYAKPKDIDKAIHFYTLAAEYRADASWFLSNIYEKYPKPIQDFEKAVKYKAKAANMGNTYAMMSLGQAYEKARLGLSADHGLALKYYEMAKDAGHVDAHAWLSTFYRDAEPEYRNYDKMVSHAQKSMLFNNHPMAFSVMGDAYLKGRGVEKNEKLAVRYYSKAAKRGNHYAIHKLSYLETDGMELKDHGFQYRDVIIPYAVKNAINYPEHFHAVYKLVHDDSINPLVKSRIFEYYADGFLEKHNDGYVPLHLLSSLYSGQGYSSHLLPVVQAYETASSYTSGEHAYELGLIYMSGSGVQRNPSVSLEWISKAMDAGFPDERDYVGLYLQHPDNPLERETQSARDLLQKAAAMGSEVASETLGTFYQDGIGVDADKAMALYWFNHADKGRTDKGDVLHTLRKGMNTDEITKAEYLIQNCKKRDLSICSQKL